MQLSKQPIKAAVFGLWINDQPLPSAADETLTEASNLLTEAEPTVELVHSEQIRLRQINSGTLFGKGKVAFLKQLIADLGIQLVFIDGKVSPIQQRNLQQIWNCPVTDRTGVILRVFKRHALSNAGRLQVQMAYLQYQRTRLVRCWKHLERQRGSTSKVSGPGEKQIELDRRLLDKQVAKLKLRLNKLARTSALQRVTRKRKAIPLVALVGYTSAGKTTLHNQLTKAQLTTAATPFTTLDTVARRLKLPNNHYCLINDTIGFVRDLPPQLISAFRTTLQDVREADLILHVQDLASAQLSLRSETVVAILQQMAIPDLEEKMINVYNKLDLATEVNLDTEERLVISALTGKNCELLLAVLAERLTALGFFTPGNAEIETGQEVT